MKAFMASTSRIIRIGNPAGEVSPGSVAPSVYVWIPFFITS